MSASKSLSIYREDPEVLQTLKEEYESIGFSTKVEGKRLTVFATKPVEGRTKKRQQPQDKRRDRDDD